MGWFLPLKSDFGLTQPPCGPDRLKLQYTSLASLNRPTGCARQQREAAEWIFRILNSALPYENPLLQKLFLLAHTAGEDLSALEVMAAATSSFGEISPNWSPRNVQPPHRSQIEPSKVLTTFEAWDTWGGTPDASMLTADVIVFWDQRVKALRSQSGDAPDLRVPERFHTHLAKKSIYLLGNELSIAGSTALAFEQQKPPPHKRLPGGGFHSVSAPYVGLFIVANSIILDTARSNEKWGLLSREDVKQYPVLAVKDGHVVISARNFSLGSSIKERPQRIWETIVPSMSLASAKQCSLSARTLQFAAKGIDPSNLYLPDFLSAPAKENCLQAAMIAWSKVLDYEISTKPSNVMHRFVVVTYAGLRKPPYATSLVEAQAFVGQKALTAWNVAAAKRLQFQIQAAELQDDRDGLGRALRDAGTLRTRFLVQPDTSTAGELSEVFAKIAAVRDAKKSTRIVTRGSEYLEEPSLAGKLLIGSATSNDTWIIPDRLVLSPVSGNGTQLYFGREWVSQNSGETFNVSLQFSASILSSSLTEHLASRAMSRKGLKYVGTASDVIFTGVRQSSSPEWVFDNVSLLGENRFLITIKTSEGYLPVLHEQLNRPPGIPIVLDWESISDPKANSQQYGPIQTTLGLFSLPWKKLPVEGGVVVNDAPFSVEVVTASGPASHVVLDPPIKIPAKASRLIDFRGAVNFHSAETVIDASGTMPLHSKLAVVSPQWNVFTVAFYNRQDSIQGSEVKALILEVTIVDDEGTSVSQPFRLQLGRFGLPDATQSIRLLVPPNFRIRYEGVWHLADGGIHPVKPGESGHVNIQILE